MERKVAWRRSLGALVAVVGGLLTIPVLAPLGDLWRSLGQAVGTGVAVPVSLGVDIALLIVLGGLCALLVRSWWSLLVVPVGYFVGWLAGGVLDALLPGHAFEGGPLGTLLLAAGIFLVGMLVPLLGGAAIGTALSRRWRPGRRAMPSG